MACPSHVFVRDSQQRDQILRPTLAAAAHRVSGSSNMVSGQQQRSAGLISQTYKAIPHQANTNMEAGSKQKEDWFGPSETLADTQL